MIIKNENQSNSCSPGKTWVKPCNRTTTNKAGQKHTNPVRGYCRTNRSKKIILTHIEIELIEKNFSELTGPPSNNNLNFPDGNKYDVLIRGWVDYWNSIFKLVEPLDPDLVKALIATESSFDWKKKNKESSAKGLMQLLNKTINCLGSSEEMHDYLIVVNKRKILDPNINICCGIRWLFRKKQLAERHGKMTWYDAVYEYKGKNAEAKLGVERLDFYYKKLKKNE